MYNADPGLLKIETSLKEANAAKSEELMKEKKQYGNCQRFKCGTKTNGNHPLFCSSHTELYYLLKVW